TNYDPPPLVYSVNQNFPKTGLKKNGFKIKKNRARAWRAPVQKTLNKHVPRDIPMSWYLLF
ncbi:MAG: hypothetical protein KBT45_07130, partial [Bacteroidales bacterium]|nr:hypothetical protein [Candidatus Colimorpha pelethequi]